MSASPESTKKETRFTMEDMRRVNDGFLKHEGLELSETNLKHALAHCNGEISDKELTERIGVGVSCEENHPWLARGRR